MALSVLLQPFSVLGLMASHFGTYRTVHSKEISIIIVRNDSTLISTALLSL